MRRLLGLLAALPIAAGIACADISDPECGNVVAQVLSDPRLSDVGPLRSVAVDRKGLLYVGGDRVVSFDGRRVEFLPCGNPRNIRGLAVDRENRVWLCADNEIGCFEADATGQRSYRSLAPLIPVTFRLGEATGIRVGETGVHFLGTRGVLTWTGTQMLARAWTREGEAAAFVARGEIFVGEPQGGLIRFDGHGWADALPRAVQAKRVLWGASAGDGRLMLGCDSGIWLAEGEEAWAAPSSPDDLAGARVRHAHALAQGRVVVPGTRGNALVLDRNGTVIRQIGPTSGLRGDGLDLA